MNKGDIKEFLTKQDTLRDTINKNVDIVLSQINIDALLKNPRKVLNETVKKIIKKDAPVFKKSSANGEELSKKL